MSEMKDRTELEMARKYELENTRKVPKEQRPSVHLCAPIGWMNDPNGFSYYKNEYHLFYQYHPYSTNWGSIHWGHSKTRDLISWEQLPVALAPDMKYDKQGCFSGSAIEFEGKHVLMYTGVEEKEILDGNKEVRQTQCIAIGDGINYEKMNINPVIKSDTLPVGSSMADFRDPKLWQDKDTIYSVIGSRAADGIGQIALYSTKNLADWKFEAILDRSAGKVGSMWECPDFFSMKDKYVLITSPQEMKAEGLLYHNGNGTIYIIGSYDKNTHKFTREKMSAIDFGLDFYAPQTVKHADGRRIMIAWMQSWDNYLCPAEFEWSGIMTIPRELEYRDGKLYQNPVKELCNYYTNKVVLEDIISNDTHSLAGIDGREIDMTIEVEEGDYQSFQIQLAKNEEYYTTITFEANENIVTFDRNYSGLKKDTIYSRSMYVSNQNGKIKMRIIMDKYTVELFVNDGEQAMSSLIYTPIEAIDITLCAKGNIKFRIEKYSIS